MSNEDIRSYAKENKVALWMIAKRLGVSEPTITRWLRIELEPLKKQEFMNVIDEIAFHNKQMKEGER